MTEQEAYGQAFENGRKLGYEQGKRDAVKHSEWKFYHKKGIAVCKNCSFEWQDDCQECGIQPIRVNYCPNCGCRMDGERKEDT